MQKKIKLLLAESFFVLCCVAGAAYSAFLFQNELYRTLRKTNEDPIATIRIKENIAQRKFLDGFVWDRLKEDAPVYEGDTIHTSAKSAASIEFLNNTSIELDENTLIRVSVKDDSGAIDIDSGNITVNAIGQKITLKTGNSVIDIAQGTTLTAENSGNGDVKIQVQSGSATITGEKGQMTLEQGLILEFKDDGSKVEKHLEVLSPGLKDGYLSFNESGFDVPFVWRNTDNVTVQVSSRRDFSKIEYERTYNGLDRATVHIAPGTYYWRVISGEERQNGKVQVLYSAPPALISPTTDYTTAYRTKKAPVRFIWTSSLLASAYRFEISASSSMTNPVVSESLSGTSRIITTLDAGKYYWRVTPYYKINNVGYASPSEVNSFEIIKRGELERPVLIMPQNNALVNTKLPISNGQTAYKSIYLSWKNNPDAVSNEVKMWAEGHKAEPVVNVRIPGNFYTVDTSVVSVPNGKWYWQVAQYDSEGNVSLSETREFLAIDENINQRTLFPPDGYHISEARTQDTRFVWKSNVPADTIFEIATDESFDHVLVSNVTRNTSFDGRYFAPGTYYWRIRSELKGVNLNSTVKRFFVDPPMGAPILSDPANNGVAVIRPRTPYELKWTAVEGADYYQVKIYQPGNKNAVIYDRNFIEGPKTGLVSHKIDFENYAETVYSISLQAFKEETTLTSRASGLLGEYSFKIVKIKPIEMVRPANKVVIDGVAAIKNPGNFEWKYVGVPAKSEIVVYKDKYDPKNEFMRITNPPQISKMPVFYEGKYFWIAKGLTADNYDISALDPMEFTVTEVSKLDSPAMNLPKNRAVLDKEYFKNNRTIVFEWGTVPGADQYILKITDPKKNVLVNQKLSSKETRYVFDKIDQLSVGTFTWTIEAQSVWEGHVFQHGKENKQTFRINLPSLNKPKTYDQGIRYGK
ncbi:MAG: FecR family protein [Treponema sp.]|nr:FecR family protein [Treponema sp.]